MVKEINSDSRRKVLVIITIVLDILLIVGSLPCLFSELFFVGLAFIITAIILTLVFVIIIISFSNMKNNSNEIMQKGYKVNGTIISSDYRKEILMEEIIFIIG